MPQLTNPESIEVALDCGRRIHVDALYIQQTYLGLLEGRPTPGYDRSIVEEAKTEMEPIWGKRKTHVVLPPKFGEQSMPAMRFAAWLTCWEPVKDPMECGSHLIVVWFTDDFARRTLEQIVADVVKALPWDDLAEDFSV